MTDVQNPADVRTTGMRVIVLLRRLVGAAHADRPHLFGCERAALDAALGLREQLDCAVTAVSVGAIDRQGQLLSLALSEGCERAVCVCPGQLARDKPWTDDSMDDLCMAEITRAAVMRLGFEVLVCGDRSRDQYHGLVGPAVAELLGIPHITNVVDVRPTGTPGRLIIEQRGNGMLHRYDGAPPFVLSVLAHSRRSQDPVPDAVDPAVELWQADELAMEPHRLQHSLAGAVVLEPPRPCQMLSSAGALLARLREDRLLR